MIVIAYNNYFDHPLPIKNLNDESNIEVMTRYFKFFHKIL